jgi:DNA-directed RNA polymerase subunit RPC12/RpoP
VTLIRFTCPSCRSVLECADSKAGSKVACPKCGQRLLIPAPATPRNKTVLGKLVPVAEIMHAPPPDTALPFAPPDVDVSVPCVGNLVARSSKRANRWRFLSPSFLLLAIIVTPLPWVQVSCSGGSESGKILVSQSGLQSAYGGMSLHPALEVEREKDERLRREGKLPPGRKPIEWGALDSFALFIILSLGFLSAGIIFGVSITRPGARRFLIGGTAVLSLGALALQSVVGFPLERRVHRARVEMAMENGRNTTDSQIISAFAIDVRYTAWFWLAILFHLGAIAVLGAEQYLSSLLSHHELTGTKILAKFE